MLHGDGIALLQHLLQFGRRCGRIVGRRGGASGAIGRRLRAEIAGRRRCRARWWNRWRRRRSLPCHGSMFELALVNSFKEPLYVEIRFATAHSEDVAYATFKIPMQSFAWKVCNGEHRIGDCIGTVDRLLSGDGVPPLMRMIQEVHGVPGLHLDLTRTSARIRVAFCVYAIRVQSLVNRLRKLVAQSHEAGFLSSAGYRDGVPCSSALVIELIHHPIQLLEELTGTIKRQGRFSISRLHILLELFDALLIFKLIQDRNVFASPLSKRSQGHYGIPLAAILHVRLESCILEVVDTLLCSFDRIFVVFDFRNTAVLLNASNRRFDSIEKSTLRWIWSQRLGGENPRTAFEYLVEAASFPGRSWRWRRRRATAGRLTHCLSGMFASEMDQHRVA